MRLLCKGDVFFDCKSAIDQFVEGLDEVYIIIIVHFSCYQYISTMTLVI